MKCKAIKHQVTPCILLLLVCCNSFVESYQQRYGGHKNVKGSDVTFHKPNVHSAHSYQSMMVMSSASANFQRPVKRPPWQQQRSQRAEVINIDLSPIARNPSYIFPSRQEYQSEIVRAPKTMFRGNANDFRVNKHNYPHLSWNNQQGYKGQSGLLMSASYQKPTYQPIPYIVKNYVKYPVHVYPKNAANLVQGSIYYPNNGRPITQNAASSINVKPTYHYTRPSTVITSSATKSTKTIIPPCCSDITPWKPLTKYIPTKLASPTTPEPQLSMFLPYKENIGASTSNVKLVAAHVPIGEVENMIPFHARIPISVMVPIPQNMTVIDIWSSHPPVAATTMSPILPPTLPSTPSSTSMVEIFTVQNRTTTEIPVSSGPTETVSEIPVTHIGLNSSEEFANTSIPASDESSTVQPDDEPAVGESTIQDVPGVTEDTIASEDVPFSGPTTESFFQEILKDIFSPTEGGSSAGSDGGDEEEEESDSKPSKPSDDEAEGDDGDDSINSETPADSENEEPSNVVEVTTNLDANEANAQEPTEGSSVGEISTEASEIPDAVADNTTAIAAEDEQTTEAGVVETSTEIAVTESDPTAAQNESPEQTGTTESSNAGEETPAEDDATGGEDSEPAAGDNEPPGGEDSEPAADDNEPPVGEDSEPAAGDNETPGGEDSEPAAGDNETPAGEDSEPAAGDNETPAEDIPEDTAEETPTTNRPKPSKKPPKEEKPEEDEPEEEKKPEKEEEPEEEKPSSNNEEEEKPEAAPEDEQPPEDPSVGENVPQDLQPQEEFPGGPLEGNLNPEGIPNADVPTPPLDGNPVEGVPGDATAADAAGDATTGDAPTDVNSEDVPSETNSEDAPVEANSEDASSDAISEDAQRGANSEDAPSDAISDEAPSDTTSEDAPIDAISEDEPSDAISEDEPSDAISEDVPSEAISKDVPSDAISEDVPSDAISEDVPSDAISEDVPNDANIENVEDELVESTADDVPDVPTEGEAEIGNNEALIDQPELNLPADAEQGLRSFGSIDSEQPTDLSIPELPEINGEIFESLTSEDGVGNLTSAEDEAGSLDSRAQGTRVLSEDSEIIGSSIDEQFSPDNDLSIAEFANIPKGEDIPGLDQSRLTGFVSSGSGDEVPPFAQYRPNENVLLPPNYIDCFGDTKNLSQCHTNESRHEGGVGQFFPKDLLCIPQDYVPGVNFEHLPKDLPPCDVSKFVDDNGIHLRIQVQQQLSSDKHVEAVNDHISTVIEVATPDEEPQPERTPILSGSITSGTKDESLATVSTPVAGIPDSQSLSVHLSHVVIDPAQDVLPLSSITSDGKSINSTEPVSFKSSVLLSTGTEPSRNSEIEQDVQLVVNVAIEPPFAEPSVGPLEGDTPEAELNPLPPDERKEVDKYLSLDLSREKPTVKV